MGLLAGFEKLPDRRTKQVAGRGSLEPAWFRRLIFVVINRIRSTVTGGLVDGLRTEPFFCFQGRGFFKIRREMDS